jgi:Tol biopolymer transport system component
MQIQRPATPAPVMMPEPEPMLMPEPEPLSVPEPMDSASPEPPEPPPPAPCRSFGPFGEPEPITGLDLDVQGSADVPNLGALGPVFSADGLTLLFSVVDEDENIFSATRAPGSAQFAPAQQVPNLDTGGSDEGTPFLSFDGLSLYFFSTRPGPGVQGDRDIWVARRDSVDAEFGAPAVLPAVNGPDLEHLPRLSRDELSIAFVSGRDSPNGASNLWVATRASRSVDFSAAAEVPGINTNAREEGFSFSEDGLTLFFSSNRADGSNMDLFVATRPDIGASFGAPQPLEDLNSGVEDLDPQLSPDGLELFFSSDRAGAFGIFRAVRQCLDP